jgi:hypothetical protein
MSREKHATFSKFILVGPHGPLKTACAASNNVTKKGPAIFAGP